MDLNKARIEHSTLLDIDSQIILAQKQTWQALAKIAGRITPGMSETSAIKVAQATLLEMGVRKFWHKCHVRFGKSTVRSFDDTYVDEVLKPEDIFSLDIGPIWNGIEGDAGDTFLVGKNSKFAQCKEDVKKVYDATASYWRESQVSGEELYAFAKQQAESLGWDLSPNYVRGHRLGEFPHSIHSKLTLGEVTFTPSTLRWILEIHICDPDLQFGAFYEDTLK